MPIIVKRWRCKWPWVTRQFHELRDNEAEVFVRSIASCLLELKFFFEIRSPVHLYSQRSDWAWGVLCNNVAFRRDYYFFPSFQIDGDAHVFWAPRWQTICNLWRDSRRNSTTHDAILARRATEKTFGDSRMYTRSVRVYTRGNCHSVGSSGYFLAGRILLRIPGRPKRAHRISLYTFISSFFVITYCRHVSLSNL